MLEREEALKRLTSAYVEMESSAWIRAMLATFTELLTTLEKNGALERAEIMQMITRLDTHGAAMTRVAPETAKKLTDITLILRHTFEETRSPRSGN